MRGEHCVMGASILSAIAVIMLVFAHIGQISTGGLVNSIYFAEVNVEAYGNAYLTSQKATPTGLYNAKNDNLGGGKGMRQYYRYGMYGACAYQKDGSGICNGTSFAYQMEPLSQILADNPPKYQKTFEAIIPDSSFKNNSMNAGMSRAGSLMIFVGSFFAAIALVFGVFKFRIFFLIAAISAGLSSLLLLVGAALWTVLISKDNWINIVKVNGGASLGIVTTAGPSLYLTWVAFAMITLAVAPYVIACCTFTRNK